MMRCWAVAGLAMFLMACGNNGPPDPQRDWAHVLSRKKAATVPSASTRQRQIYADTLGAFLQKHPQHSRARVVYQRIQLDFARELATLGRYQDAMRFYRAVLSRDPSNVDAARGMSEAVDRLAVSREKLLALEKGMTQRQVAHILGKPMPGWRLVNTRREPVAESWYYRTTEGGVAGVYFRDGVLFAAEARSHQKVAPLTQ
jgi:hypothetical protein